MWMIYDYRKVLLAAAQKQTTSEIVASYLSCDKNLYPVC